MIYRTADHGILCQECADGKNGSRATDPNLDSECPDDDQWRIVGRGAQHDEKRCDHCDKVIARVPRSYS